MQLIPFNRKKRHQTDEELLQFFLDKQDNEVLGKLYSRYMHLVYGLCLKYFKEPEKSKDAVIHIYEKIQNEIQKHSITNFKNWLYVVTKNHCLMELRKSKQGMMVLGYRDEELNYFMENERELHPIDKEHDELIDKALLNCIEKLKSDQKKCIQMLPQNSIHLENWN